MQAPETTLAFFGGASSSPVSREALLRLGTVEPFDAGVLDLGLRDVAEPGADPCLDHLAHSSSRRAGDAEALLGRQATEQLEVPRGLLGEVSLARRRIRRDDTRSR